MPKALLMDYPTDRNSHVVTGPTSKKLDEVRKTIENKGQRAASVVYELSDIARVPRAAVEIVALRLPIVGLLLTLLDQFTKYWSTPKRAAQVITEALLDESSKTGIYYARAGVQCSALRSCATRNSRRASLTRRAPSYGRSKLDRQRRDLNTD
jgi:hypothetical protein